MNWLTTQPSPILVLLISMARLAAAFLIVPFFAQQFLSGVTRNAVTLALAVILWPLIAGTLPAETLPPIYLLVILVKEIIIGIMLGFVASLPFWVADSTGFFIDNQKGTTLASVFNPLSGEQTSPTGLFLVQLVTTLFFTSGGFLLFLGSMYESYRLLPVFEFFPKFTAGFPTFFLGYLDQVMRLTVTFAAPVLICLFLAEFGLGLMNRFAPQLNVFSLSMGVKAGVAGLVLVLYMSFLFLYLKGSILGGTRWAELLRGVISG